MGSQRSFPRKYVDMSIYSPVLMEAAAAGAQAFQWAAVTYGPFAIGNTLYCFLSNNSSASGIFSSIDRGATWNEIDAANHVASAASVPYFDAAGNRLIVAYRVPGAGLQAIRLINFDFAAQTWGAAYAAAGAPTCTAVCSVVKRSDNTVFVLYDVAPPIPAAPASNSKAGIFSQPDSGGVWTTTVDVGVNLRAEASWIAGTRITTVQCGVFCDANGVVHLTLPNTGSGIYAYQQVTLANTLANYHLFTDAGLVAVSGTPISAPIIFNGILVIAACITGGGVGTYATVYTAPNPAAPVFTLLGLNGMESQFSIDNFLVPKNNPRLAIKPDGSILYAVYSAADINGTNFADIHICSNSGDPGTAADWTDNNVWQLALDSPPGFNYGSQQVQLAGLVVTDRNLLLSADANHPSAPHVEERYWFGVFTLPMLRLNQQQLTTIVLPNPMMEC
jgi:hypothetical protein